MSYSCYNISSAASQRRANRIGNTATQQRTHTHTSGTFCRIKHHRTIAL